ncbi:uncharacterized protein LOC117574982 [Drosophila albomicans]|uniref:Uncharacterized protein LOC117574982 n=1 Tax=Drosophila albomicans TaxID=7291 RepID=A0A6P8XP99_DROAB|nr:uncharacterized protein LOC117574982 [Drosophila albomicans]
MPEFNDSKDFNVSLVKGETTKGSNDAKSAHKLNKACKKKYLEEIEHTEVHSSEFDNECAAELGEFDLAIHDAWVLQCPKGMDIASLAGKRIKMPGRRFVGDLQVRATPYAEPLQQSVGFVNARGKYSLRRVPLAGHMIVSKRLNQEKPDADADGDDESSAFPKPSRPQKFKLPVRHPFFGRDYQERIEVNKKTSKQLRHAEKKSSEATVRLRNTSNFYKVRSKLLATTQTLEEKEHDVRQSVLTGVLPKFMAETVPPSYVDLTTGDDDEPEGPKKKRKSKANGVVDNDVQAAESSSKKKKRQAESNEEETVVKPKKAKKLKSS